MVLRKRLCISRLFTAIMVVLMAVPLRATYAAPKKQTAHSSRRAPSSLVVKQQTKGMSSRITVRSFDDRNEIRIPARSRSPQFSLDQLPSPSRLVIDLEGEKLPVGSALGSTSWSYVSGVRIGSHPTKTRVVVDLKGSTALAHATYMDGTTLVVKVSPREEADAKRPAEKLLQSAHKREASHANTVSQEVRKAGLSLDEDVVISGSSSSGTSMTSGVSTASETTKRVNLEKSLSVKPREQPQPAKVVEESVQERTAELAAAQPLSVKPKTFPVALKEVEGETHEASSKDGKPAQVGVEEPAFEGARAAVVPEHKAESVAAQLLPLESETLPAVLEKVPTNAKESTSKDQESVRVHSVALESNGKASPAVVVGLQGAPEYGMSRTAPSEYVLTLRNTLVDAAALKKTLFAAADSSGIRSVRTTREGDHTLVRIFTQPSSYLTARKVGNDLRIEETQDLARIARDIRAQMAPPADPKSKDSVDPTKPVAQPAPSGANPPSKQDTLKKSVEVPAKTDTTAANKGLKASQAGVSDGSAPKRGSPTVSEREFAAINGSSPTYTGRLISLDLQDADIDSALRIIAEVSSLNIVAGDGVAGKVTLKLVDVPWDQALDVILKSQGLDKVLEGNVLRVAPVDKLKQERESFKEARVAEEELEPLSVKYMRISYAKASEIKALVETVLTERGSVAFDERSNQLVVKDVRKGLQNVTELIKKVDLRTPQILLETQIIEASRNLSRQLGSELGFQYIQSPATGNGTGLNFPSAVAVGGSADPTTVGSITGSAFPVASSATLGSAVTMLFDSADGTKSLALRLSQLEQEGQVRIISKPAVATTNNKPAEIKSVEKFRVKLPNGGLSIATGSGAQSSGAGDVATQTIEAGIVLNVTPQASPDYYILLDIKAKSSSFGAKEVDGIPNEIERSASSSVLVSSGQTFALGGIYKINERDSVSGVPFFKDIPVLGTFFRNMTTENSDEELLFFITPRIVEGSFEDASMKIVS
jgi:type IV pilus secretin PilQ/predicted competence protein